jgi:hypothetical protein
MSMQERRRDGLGWREASRWRIAHAIYVFIIIIIIYLLFFGERYG